MIDINAKFGHWPYRPVRGVDALLGAMDEYGVERAVVSSLSAVHFLNPQDGNEELARIAAPHRDRLTPFAVLRPDFAGWEDDVHACIEGHGMKGVVLYPNYHGFELSDPALGVLMSGGFPVCVQTGLEDVRRQYRPYKTEEVAASDVGAFARQYPSAKVIALGLKFGQPQQAGDPLPPNLYFDTSNYEALGGLESAVEHFGSGKILFGSNFPLFNPLANVDKVGRADIGETDREAIAFGNAARLLGV